LLEVSRAFNYEIFREHVRSEGALENTVLSVVQEVPSNDEDSPVCIIDDEKLDQVLDTS